MADQNTPMMRQYWGIRRELSKDTLLFFRLGDFYEMFGEDAKTAARILDITLTRRNKMPMCGIPYHQLDSYLAKTIRAGVKVAICDQVEDPAEAKGIVRREVTRVVTPGTILEENVLEANRNNYLAGLARNGPLLGLALLDLSTGEFWIEESAEAAAIGDTLLRYAPSECILPESLHDDAGLRAVLRPEAGMVLSRQEDWIFEPEAAAEVLLRHFKVASLAGFGCEHATAGVAAAGAVLHYVGGELRRRIGHVTRLRLRNPAAYLLLDETTVANLNLAGPRHPGRDGGPSLLQILDATRTAMGARRLRQWLLRPLRELAAIRARHEAVADGVTRRTALGDLRDTLGAVKDLERLVARIGAGSGNARDVKALGASLGILADVKDRLKPFPARRWRELDEGIRLLPDLVELIGRAIVEEPPATLREGGLIRAGYHAELDTLKAAATEGRRWLAEYQAREQAATGIRSLKVRHNKVFGYYIEVTKTQLDQIPGHYVRKQTLVNAERFITDELKEYENRILGAQDRARDLEYELFAAVRDQIVAATDAVQANAEAIAEIDVLAALADRALVLRYVRPEVDEGTRLEITDGRHPVIEALPDAERFVPNHALLDTLENQLLVITGPNMAGKSTYIRQVALIVILAQMGSFVPAAAARVGLVDRVFTRVGASDDLARGRSTFMVEMQETANILNNATPRSLIVLDEIGRGTSTFDGISIAWAVAEFLHNNPAVKAKTLFATHYHELTDLALTLPGVRNYNVLVKEGGDRIAFLRKIVPGGADKSYGIQVARLAGLPAEVIRRANEILANLEEGEFEAQGEEKGQPKIARARPRRDRDVPRQLSLFGD